MTRFHVGFPNVSNQGGRSERLFRLEESERRGRRPRRGFPWTGRFTPEEARRYLDGARLVCLLCGRELAVLGKHLSCVHGVSVYDYQCRYGLPISRGLAGNVARRKMAASCRRRLEAGELEPVGPGGPAGPQRASPYHAAVSAAHGYGSRAPGAE